MAKSTYNWRNKTVSTVKKSCQYPRRLGTQELSPGLPAPWCRSEARPAEDAPDRGGADPCAEPAQFPLYPQASPAAVLLAATNDQLDCLLR
jgi:hypothetical protein